MTTECRRKTISSTATSSPQIHHQSPFSSSSQTHHQQHLPKSTSHPHSTNSTNLLQLLQSSSLSTQTTGTPTFMFNSPERRKKRTPLHDSNKSNMSASTSPINLNIVPAPKLFPTTSHTSPSPTLMKRSDVAILNLDQASLGSPLAKRPPKRPPHQHPNTTHQQHFTSSSPIGGTTTPRRPPSRSISTHPRPQSAQPPLSRPEGLSTPAPPQMSKLSRRISVENFLRPPSRDSPFGIPIPVQNASIHTLPQGQGQGAAKKIKPHPLSLSTSIFSSPSSSSSSSTTHSTIIPLTRQNAHTAPTTNHPSGTFLNPRIQTLQDSSNGHFSTPQNYKLAKPLQAAFMSEGLLSKRNRSNSTGNPLTPHLSMPDTPCKRPLSSTLATFSLSNFTTDPSTPLTNKHSVFGSGESSADGKSTSSQDTPAPVRMTSSPLLLNDEFPPTPTKSVDLGTTNSGLWTLGDLRGIHPLDISLGTNLEEGDQERREKVQQFEEANERRRRSTTNGGRLHFADAADILSSGRFGEKFEDVRRMGTGEFSEVYEVVDKSTKVKYAIKRTRYPLGGPKERQRRLEEVKTLRELGKHEHILELIDSWEQYDHLFIQTELCENGSLDIFLRDYGNIERLDEFRVWKILVELTLGLQHIHNSNYIHLDIKPANVFITFEGTLKIGDFGLATHLPVPAGLEREGDREYIAPEILELQQYGKEADIFSLGMTILESAANVCLPDNGLPWQKLRSGDLSDAPRLSSSDEARLGVGSVEEDGMDVDGGAMVQYAKGLQPGKLDEIVKWMLSPKPGDRPSCQDLLQNEQIRWVDSRRRAGAVIYEGDFGPESEVDEDKEEMEDVDWQMEL